RPKAIGQPLAADHSAALGVPLFASAAAATRRDPATPVTARVLVGKLAVRLPQLSPPAAGNSEPLRASRAVSTGLDGLGAPDRKAGPPRVPRSRSAQGLAPQHLPGQLVRGTLG